MYIKQGDKVPADIRIFSCPASGLYMDHSSLTGELYPKHLYTTPFEVKRDALESPVMAFNGTIVESGEGYGIVLKIGKETALGKISELMQYILFLIRLRQPRRLSKLSIEIQFFSQVISTVMMLVGGVLAIVSLILNRSFNSTLLFVVGIAVASVPQGLAATINLILAISAKRMVHSI